eukprot:CAMPEP_0197824874 /NCGR_PEP_ID=MMETSP1437-20131217/2077_1 /TAXON_ID=49252 ORGANISM="Eucampia antarctica, Strain CCMP1452" /NCGR_SAMPLE_ID=MMETSP1437 /ASSEMBLY_ACC=CAM_ASM_001096 /LENGTH=494 /DNA_ID=CAMNT_0043424675 /DNA_START=106 /DNA_END=1590 /DNA_ORIENTATION=+
MSLENGENDARASMEAARIEVVAAEKEIQSIKAALRSAETNNEPEEENSFKITIVKVSGLPETSEPIMKFQLSSPVEEITLTKEGEDGAFHGVDTSSATLTCEVMDKDIPLGISAVLEVAPLCESNGKDSTNPAEMDIAIVPLTSDDAEEPELSSADSEFEDAVEEQVVDDTKDSSEDVVVVTSTKDNEDEDVVIVTTTKDNIDEDVVVESTTKDKEDEDVVVESITKDKETDEDVVVESITKDTEGIDDAVVESSTKDKENNADFVVESIAKDTEVINDVVVESTTKEKEENEAVVVESISKDKEDIEEAVQETATTNTADDVLESTSSEKGITTIEAKEQPIQQPEEVAHEEETKENEVTQKLMLPICTIRVKLEFEPAKKSRVDALSQLLNECSKRKAKAIDSLRQCAATVGRTDNNSTVAATTKEASVKAGFLNKKPKQPPIWRRWYEKTIGPQSMLRMLSPIMKNYGLFIGAVALVHFRGNDLALTPPV